MEQRSALVGKFCAAFVETHLEKWLSPAFAWIGSDDDCCDVSPLAIILFSASLSLFHFSIHPRRSSM